MIQKTMYALLLTFCLAACGNGNDNKGDSTASGTGTSDAPSGNTVEPSPDNGSATAPANNTEAANSNTPPGGNPAGAMAISKSDADKGLALIQKSDCLGCHKVDQKIVGPAYQDVAAKYPATDANIDMLASKVISGGSGNWGQIPMAPHPQISKGDAKQMIKYVLSNKKQG